MKTPTPFAPACLLVVAGAVLCLAGNSLAQTAAKPAAPAAKAGTTKSTKASKPAAKPAPAAPALPAADAEQVAAAGIAHMGDYDCEFGETVSVLATPGHEGYVDVRHKKAAYTMKPVLSSTGALRLEDVHGRILMLQIANKSMLMDTKIGQRLVDGCVHEKQREAAAKPATTSLGIEPSKP